MIVANVDWTGDFGYFFFFLGPSGRQWEVRTDVAKVKNMQTIFLVVQVFIDCWFLCVL